MVLIQQPRSPLTAAGRRQAQFLRRDEGENDADYNDDDDEWIVTASVLLSSPFSSRDVTLDNCGDDLFLPFLSVLWVSFSREVEWV